MMNRRTVPERDRSEIDAMFVEYAKTRDTRLRDQLVEAHIGLARHLAGRFTFRGEPLDELEQVALVGIMNAVDRFEPERGGQFSTFAVPTVVGELKRHFRDRGWAVRVPRRVQELHLEIGRLVGALSQELGRSPTPSELAQRAGVDEERVIEAMEAGGMYQLTSLDAPSSSGADTSAPDEFATLDQRMAIEELLATLPARERTIVELRFFDGLTQSEIAERVGISQMHVSRLLARSLNTLRDAAEA
jgi:RNA polymerase sigma-B factor